MTVSNTNTFPPPTYPAVYGFTTAVLVSSLHYHSEVILPMYLMFPSPPKTSKFLIPESERSVNPRSCFSLYILSWLNISAQYPEKTKENQIKFRKASQTARRQVNWNKVLTGSRSQLILPGPLTGSKLTWSHSKRLDTINTARISTTILPWASSLGWSSS